MHQQRLHVSLLLFLRVLSVVKTLLCFFISQTLVLLLSVFYLTINWEVEVSLHHLLSFTLAFVFLSFFLVLLFCQLQTTIHFYNSFRFMRCNLDFNKNANKTRSKRESKGCVQAQMLVPFSTESIISNVLTTQLLASCWDSLISFYWVRWTCAHFFR